MPVFFLVDLFHRKRAERAPFPPGWRDILDRRVPFYRALEADERARFENKLKVFALTKHFEGAGGMVVDEEVRVVISAAAARLTINLPDEHYGRLNEIVIYPSHYKHEGDAHTVVLGEARGPGAVVLSYEAVLHGLKNPEDGHDTAAHEFAHVLDAADGAFDGTPELASFDAYGPWSRVLGKAFGELRSRPGRARRQVLRDYGATNEAEFFAVATEAFFEKPSQMRERHPDLYQALSSYYRSDPAARGRGGRR